ncbi:PfkB family carbohydrate kinase [Brevibacterium album]|uniref:PfkB family carbohydrate kinase n=1 Tax=Brevibacterium album TaxID=417948 RepID=UPI00068826B7|nr:PfkB family carbohydrate kinase [Brevibacterium album]
MRIAVVGDALLDADVHGSAQRLSPDGPVPVVDVEETRQRAGGAGLAARLLAEAGHEVSFVTALGDDEAGEALRGSLPDVGVAAGPSRAPTPVKRRLLAGGQVVARMDEGCGAAPPPCVTDEMLTALEGADAVLVSDYGRGLCADAGLRAALRTRAAEVPLVWDPHPRGAVPVEGAAAATPNSSEAAALLGGRRPGRRDGGRAAAAVLRAWPVRAAVVTLGGTGAVALERGGGLPLFVPVPRTVGGDACGAGDRFAGALAAHLAAGGSLGMAVERSVAEASAFLAAGGVGAPDALARSGEAGTPPVWEERLAAVRADGGTIVATGGCFDLLHAGHARTLAAARRLGDFLVVCLNSDASVRRLKGEDRPLIRERDRAELLEALGCVDAVVVFDEDSPASVLARLRPDVWVKGGDYGAGSLPEASAIAGWGGETVTVPFHPARSTTALAAALGAAPAAPQRERTGRGR